jgi:hypothetical protein
MKRPAHDIAADVEMGLSMHAIAEAAKRAVEEITERLRKDALAHADEHTPLVESSREGSQWKAPGGLVVVVTADKLVASFKTGSEVQRGVFEQIENFARYVHDTDHKKEDRAAAIRKELFAPWEGYERTISDGHEFRELVRSLMPEAPPHAERVIEWLKVKDKNGVPQNDIKAEWRALATARADEAATKLAEKLVKKNAAAAKKGAAK